jgi:hypothetical protein
MPSPSLKTGTVAVYFRKDAKVSLATLRLKLPVHNRKESEQPLPISGY